jgi:hypothetical protein
MIRKMITIAAAIAIPVSAITALGAAVGTGVASARALPPTSITCAESGSAVLPKPGVNNGGTLTTKATEETKATITGANVGSGTGCSTKAIKPKIISATTPCPQTGGVPNPGDPGACLASTSKTSHGVTTVTYAIAKDPNYYGTAGGYASSAGDIGSSLPLETSDNGTKVWLEFGTSNSENVGGTCGSNTGFNLTGNVDNSTQTAAIGTYVENICVTGDTGPGTTGVFFTDLLDDVGGPPNNQSTITSLILGGDPDSSLAITIP